MRINFFKKASLILCSTFFVFNFANAQVNINSTNKLSFDISNIGGAVSELVKSTKEAVTSVFEDKKEEEVFDIEEKKDNLKSEKDNKKDLNICEVFDYTNLNSIDLDMISTRAIDRIDKIEERLDQETGLRLEIFEKNKKLTDLQKKEKIVFREMRKEIDEAKIFYKKIDEVVVETNVFLEVVDCYNINKKDTKTLLETYNKTDELLTEEPIFRKTFSSSLKDKMSILQSGVKGAKDGVK